ncbi:MAG: glycoside hydrolase [Chloroflexi bacterium HGW-Chloroflexi-1]|nr:MAG: glycoside hydrolase [Chloroflexi bacterium HGW-Chloroflexi-1]
MKKEAIKNSGKVSVIFEMSAEIEAETLALVGDFNDWDQTATLMKRRKDGSWARNLRLDPGTYRFRFLADGVTWHNAWDADRYEPSGMGGDNSVVEIEAQQATGPGRNILDKVTRGQGDGVNW